jgi:hypothetical protein
MGGETSVGGRLVFDNLDGPEIPGVPHDTAGSLTFVESPTRDGSPVLKATQAGTDTAVVSHEFTPVNNTKLYFRGWVLVPEGAVNGGLKLVGLNSDQDHRVDVNLHPEGMTEIFVAPQEETAESELGSYPPGEWFCLRIHYVIGVNGGADVFIDNALTASIQNVDTAGPEMGVGFLDYGIPYVAGGQSGGVVYWDDVILDHMPVSCE